MLKWNENYPRQDNVVFSVYNGAEDEIHQYNCQGYSAAVLSARNLAWDSKSEAYDGIAYLLDHGMAPDWGGECNGGDCQVEAYVRIDDRAVICRWHKTIDEAREWAHAYRNSRKG